MISSALEGIKGARHLDLWPCPTLVCPVMVPVLLLMGNQFRMCSPEEWGLFGFEVQGTG